MNKFFHLMEKLLTLNYNLKKFKDKFFLYFNKKYIIFKHKKE